MIKFKSHNNFNYYYDENTGSLNSVPNDTIVQEKSNVINTICKKEISEKDQSGISLTGGVVLSSVEALYDGVVRERI